WSVWPFGSVGARTTTPLGPVADVNGDGYADVVLAVQSGATNDVSVLTYRGGPGEPTSVTVPLVFPLGAWMGTNSVIVQAAVAGGLAGAGRVDVVVQNGDQRYAVLRGSSGGLVMGFTIVITPLVCRGVGHAGDVDGDGYDDLAVLTATDTPASYVETGEF